MIVSHRFTKIIVIDLNFTEPFCIFDSYIGHIGHISRIGLIGHISHIGMQVW